VVSPVEPPLLSSHLHPKHDLCASFDGLRTNGSVCRNIGQV